MTSLPVMLDMRGRLAVVVGAGAVGMRKVRLLLEAGARVRLVGRDLPARPVRLKGRRRLTVVRGRYRKALLRGAAIVFACADDRKVNARVAADARAIGALVNSADRPDDCDFFMPSIIRAGPVVVAVGTGGAAPALAAWLRRRLESVMPDRIGQFASALAGLREELRSAAPDAPLRMEIMRRLAGEEGYRRFLQAGTRGLRKMLASALKAAQADTPTRGQHRDKDR